MNERGTTSKNIYVCTYFDEDSLVLFYWFLTDGLKCLLWLINSKNGDVSEKVYTNDGRPSEPEIAFIVDEWKYKPYTWIEMLYFVIAIFGCVVGVHPVWLCKAEGG